MDNLESTLKSAWNKLEEKFQMKGAIELQKPLVAKDFKKAPVVAPKPNPNLMIKAPVAEEAPVESTNSPEEAIYFAMGEGKIIQNNLEEGVETDDMGIQTDVDNFKPVHYKTLKGTVRSRCQVAQDVISKLPQGSSIEETLGAMITKIGSDSDFITEFIAGIVKTDPNTWKQDGQKEIKLVPNSVVNQESVVIFDFIILIDVITGEADGSEFYESVKLHEEYRNLLHKEFVSKLNESTKKKI